jgi:hypothetical protein
MGIAKRMMEEEEDRGYRTNYGKTVCVNCFEECGLKVFIAEHQTQTQCSYCKGKKADLFSTKSGVSETHIH